MLIPANGPLSTCGIEAGQGEEEINLEKQYDGLEIVKQSALDHFNSILQKAQKLAAKVERDGLQKWPKRYEGKSKRTLKWCKKCWEDLAKKDFLLVFEFMAVIKEKAQKKAHMEQFVARIMESKQVLEKSAPEELDTKIWCPNV